MTGGGTDPIAEAHERVPQALTAVVVNAGTEVSHNLNGQKLGRKGRVTRERILAATVELLESPQAEAISMSAVARKASLGMTSLYNYFTDFTELLLAVLEPVMVDAEDAFIGMLRERWSDEDLGERCRTFVHAYHGFWSRNARLLHLRNAMADSRDERMLFHRVRATQPMIMLFIAQMDDDPDVPNPPALGMATVLMTGLERTVTVATDARLMSLFGTSQQRDPEHYLDPEARLVELAIRDTRAKFAREGGERG